MKDQSLRVLIVEDSEDDALLIIRELKKGGYNPVYERVETAAAMKKAFKEKQWDIILCDYKMPKFNALSAIAILKAANIDIPIIIVSGTIGEDVAIECMRLGAQDYIMKGNLFRLCPAIARELEDAEVRIKQRQADEDLKESENKYRLSFENVKDVIYTIDTGLTLLSLSPSMETILGYKPQDFIGRSVSDLGNILTPESFEQAIVDISAVLNGEKISAKIYQFIAKDGTIKYGEVSGSPLMRKGKIIGIISVARDITDRRMAEYQREVALEALQENEKKYRDLYDFLPIPVYEMDFDANITSANRAIYETFRGTEEDLKKGFKAWQLLSPEEIEKSKKNIQALLKGKQIAGTEYTMMRLDGSVFPAIVISSVIYSDGKPVGLRGAVIDITERNQTEEALRQNEEKYRSILETIQEGYYEIDLAGNLTFFNDSLSRIIGYPKEELMGMNYRQYDDKESLERVFQAYNEVYKTGEPIKGFDRQIIRKDGTKRYAEVSVSLRKDLSGNPIGFRGLARDITERKQMEESLCQSEEKYRTILETVQEGYFEVDLTGNFTFFNDSLCRIIGYPREEMLGLNDQQYADKDNSKKLFQAFNKVYSTGEPSEGFDWQIIRKDGTKRYVEASVLLRKDSSGKPIGFRGIARDITERKQTEEKLLLTFASLRKAFGTTIRVMVSAVEMRDPYTSGHQTKSADIARAIVTEMGLPPDKIDGIRLAGSIHDIGKLSIPAEILSKPTKLTDIEFSLIKEHSRIGYEMLKDVESPWPLAQIVYQHHERMNGSGYPRNLKGDEILIEARIMAVADVVEAMASDRPYRPGLGIEAALEEIEKNKGLFMTMLSPMPV